METETNRLGGDLVHARTFGRYDAAVGNEPERFSQGGDDDLRKEYLSSYHDESKKISCPAQINPKFINQFPWHQMNRAAQSLGRRAKGVPKNYSADELAARTDRLAAARKKRWAGHKKKSSKKV